jgi:predicted protein tyrosine phosphatase
MKNITSIFSINSFISNLDRIKEKNLNVVSIRNSSGMFYEFYRGQKLKSNDYIYIDNKNIKNIYSVVFDDLSKDSDRVFKQYVFPQEKHIFPLLEWAKQKWEENHMPFAIHCSAGISRSSAVAILINKMIVNNIADAFDAKLHLPNREILRLGEKFLKEDDIVSQVYGIIEKDNTFTMRYGRKPLCFSHGMNAVTIIKKNILDK